MRRLRRLLTYFRARPVKAHVLDPPLPPSHWHDHWTRTEEANGFTRIRQGKTGPPDPPPEAT